MKVLLLSLEYPPDIGGVGNYYYNLVNNWPEAEKIMVLDRGSGKLLFKIKFFPWLKASFSIFKGLRKKEVDYVLVGQILPLGTAAFLASIFRPHKYALILHGLDFNLSIANRRKRLLSKLIIKRADKIICANSYLKSLVENFYPQIADKIFIVNPGIIKEKPNYDRNLLANLKVKHQEADNFILLSVGRLVRRKGFDYTILALKEIDPSLNIKYFIIGDGPDFDYLQSLIKDNKMEDRVHLLGALSEEEKWAYLNLCQVFIMPARQIDFDFEGFGIVYLEANLFKKAVIAGRSGGVPDAISDGVNGLLLNPNSIEEIKLAILKLKESPDLLNSLGEQGEIHLSDFTWDKQAEKFYKIINEL